MNLAECLARLPAGERVAYAEIAGLPAAADPAAVVRALADPRRIAEVLGVLGRVARDALILLAVGFDGQADRNVYVRELGRLHPTAAAEAVAVLERAALVSPRLLSPWWLGLVEDAAPAVRAAASAWLLESASPWVPEAKAGLTASPLAVVADAARLLGAMADGVRVKQQGGVYQADQRRLAQVFDRSRLALPSPVTRAWAGYASETLALHLALAIQLGLVTADALGWRAAPEAEAWVGLPPARQWSSLVRAWRDIGTERLGVRFDALLGAFTGGRWVDLDRWWGHLARYAHTYPPLPAAAEALFLRPGLMLGAIAPGRAESRTVFRLTEPAVAGVAGRVPDWPEPEQAVVESDFEVMLPPGVPSRVTWDLERWAHRVGVDRVARYRITRDAAQRRSRTGEPAAGWLTRLEAAARFGVPENVRFAVTEWAVPARRVQMWAAVAVRFPEGVPEGWSPPAGAQAAGPACWLLDLRAAAHEASALRRAGVVVDGVPEEWTSMERARDEHRRRAGPAPLGLPWPGPQDGDPRTPFMDEEPAGAGG